MGATNNFKSQHICITVLRPCGYLSQKAPNRKSNSGHHPPPRQRSHATFQFHLPITILVLIKQHLHGLSVYMILPTYTRIRTPARDTCTTNRVCDLQEHDTYSECHLSILTFPQEHEQAEHPPDTLGVKSHCFCSSTIICTLPKSVTASLWHGVPFGCKCCLYDLIPPTA